MNTDSRGIKRGNCLGDDCDCTSYEYDENKGPKCNYCSCPPTKHQKIDKEVENSASDSDSEAVEASSENGKKSPSPPPKREKNVRMSSRRSSPRSRQSPQPTPKTKSPKAKAAARPKRSSSDSIEDAGPKTKAAPKQKTSSSDSNEDAETVKKPPKKCAYPIKDIEFDDDDEKEHKCGPLFPLIIKSGNHKKIQQYFRHVFEDDKGWHVRYTDYKSKNSTDITAWKKILRNNGIKLSEKNSHLLNFDQEKCVCASEA